MESALLGVLCCQNTARLIKCFLIVFALCNCCNESIAAAKESQAEPKTNVEAVGWLKLEMRDDNNRPFVYPSVAEEEWCEKRGGIVKYRAYELYGYELIKSVEANIIDVDDAIVWKKYLPKTYEYRDTGFCQ